ncbi:MAG: hypothetical protein ACOCYX_00740 [Spirochaetota bacterium]
MKRYVLLSCAVLVLASAATAQTSLGVILGEPTGLSAKQWLSSDASLDLAVAWSFVPENAFYVHVDYQQHFGDLGLNVDVGRLLFFAGIGPRIYMGEALVIGGRIPLGVVYEFADAPIEMFLELAPGLNVYPRTEFTPFGGLGIRYRF